MPHAPDNQSSASSNSIGILSAAAFNALEALGLQVEKIEEILHSSNQGGIGIRQGSKIPSGYDGSGRQLYSLQPTIEDTITPLVVMDDNEGQKKVEIALEALEKLALATREQISLVNEIATSGGVEAERQWLKKLEKLKIFLHEKLNDEEDYNLMLNALSGHFQLAGWSAQDNVMRNAIRTLSIRLDKRLDAEDLITFKSLCADLFDDFYKLVIETNLEERDCLLRNYATLF